MSLVGIIGLGNIGSALLEGLATSDYDGSLVGFDRNAGKRRVAEEHDAAASVTSVEAVFREAQTVFVCVRTDQVESVLSHASEVIDDHVVACLSAGVEQTVLDEAASCQVVRVIPDVNMVEQRGVIHVLRRGRSEEDVVVDVLEDVGQVVGTSDEDVFDALSVITGATPIFVAEVAEAVRGVAEHHGLDDDQVESLVLRAVSKSAATLPDSDMSAEAYARRTMSPGGSLEEFVRSKEGQGPKRAAKTWYERLGRLFLE